MLASAAAFSALLLAPTAAELRAQQPIDEIASDLAYGLCPLFLAGQLPLTSSELTDRGFSSIVRREPHPRLGEMNLVTAKKPDGEIAFGGASGKACTVMVNSPKRAAVLAKLHANMALTGLAFKTAPAPVPAPALPGLVVETFKAPVQGQFLYVQLIQTGADGPVVAQLFVTEK